MFAIEFSFTVDDKVFFLSSRVVVRVNKTDFHALFLFLEISSFQVFFFFSGHQSFDDPIFSKGPGEIRS